MVGAIRFGTSAKIDECANGLCSNDVYWRVIDSHIHDLTPLAASALDDLIRELSIPSDK